MFRKMSAFLVTALLALSIAGCSSQNPPATSSPSVGGNDVPSSSPTTPVGGTNTDNSGEDRHTAAPAATKLVVRFGDDGADFTLHLEDNDTAAAIAGHVGTAAWRLPIYHYDDYDNWEVMQYYDIPSRYDVPSSPTTVTAEKAGEVYYSDPNRIILFYQDAEVTGDYTKVGTFDATEEFVAAVRDNPVLEGWGNKIVHIDSAQ